MLTPQDKSNLQTLRVMPGYAVLSKLMDEEIKRAQFDLLDIPGHERDKVLASQNRCRAFVEFVNNLESAVERYTVTEVAAVEPKALSAREHILASL